MVTYLLEKGEMETTLTRAKEVRALCEKMITLGKKGTLAARRQALAFITKEDVVKKLFDQIAPSYESRTGGYTVIYKLGPRRGDGAELALIRLVKDEVVEEEKASKGKGKAKAKTAAKPKKATATAKVEAKADDIEDLNVETEVAADDVVEDDSVAEVAEDEAVAEVVETTEADDSSETE